MRSIIAAACLLAFLGAGCSPSAEEASAEDVDMHAGATMTVAQNWTGLNPLSSDTTLGVRALTIDEWTVGEAAAVSWTHNERHETDASKVARDAAAHAPIGEAVEMPDPVYETVTTSGTIMTDALDNAARIALPSYWPEGEYDVSGEENSLLWLSRAQYDELVATRTSHIALGLFDSTLAGIIGFGENVEGALAKLQGNIAQGDAQSNADVTKLTAEADWGDYTVVLNGKLSTVRTVEASSMFANYVILANPENPLILKVAMKPLSLGLGMLTTMNLINSLAGYHVTAITY